MLENWWHWPLVAASLFGVVLNIKRRRGCFYIWAVTNATWAAIDVAHGLPSQAVLQGVYFGFAVYGIIEWKAKVA